MERVPSEPKPCGKAGLNRTEAALDRLGITSAQLEKVAPLSSILKDIPKGRAMAITAMRFSKSPLIIQFLEKYDDVPERDRRSLPLEAVALAAAIDAQHLFGEILLAMREHSVNAVKFIAVATHPRVMKKRVEFAQTAGGTRDRDALDTMLGALPSNKGNTFINKFFAGNTDPDEDDKPETAPVVEELVGDADFIFPNAEDMQDRLQPLRQKRLEAGK